MTTATPKKGSKRPLFYGSTDRRPRIMTGEPIIVSDPSADRELHEERDKRLGYRTRNLAQVPLKSSDRIIGALLRH